MQLMLQKDVQDVMAVPRVTRGTNSTAIWLRCANAHGTADAPHLDDIGTKVRQQGATEVASNHLTNIKNLHKRRRSCTVTV